MKSNRYIYFLLLLFFSCDSLFLNEQPPKPLIELLSDEVDLKMRKADLTIRVKIHDEIPSGWARYGSILYISTDPVPTEENRVGFDQIEEIGNVYLDLETNEGISWRSIVALEPNTTYYYEHIAFYDNMLDDIERQRVSTGIKSFTTKEEILEYGGIVFYDKGVTTDGWQYLVAAPKGWYEETALNDPWLSWGCDTTFVEGLEDGLGMGLLNTQKIVDENCSTVGAAHFVSDLELNSYDDWYLPAPAEVRLIFKDVDISHCCYSMTSINTSKTDVWVQGYYVEWPGGNEPKTDLWGFRPIRRQ